MRKILFMLLATIFILTSATEAAKIDRYRDALINKNFTLRYEVSTVPVYNSLKSGKLTFKGELLGKQETSFEVHKGIIVVNGEDRYTEISQDAREMSLNDWYALSNDVRFLASKVNVQNKTVKIFEYGKCLLLKGGEVFQFVWSSEGNKRKYSGKVKWWEYKRGEVKADVDISRTPYQDLIEEYNYGVPEIALMIMPLLPREKVIATSWTPDYKFFGSGSLANGLTYEDYVSNKDNLYSAVRYYFSGNDLVKIAHASYVKSGGKVQSYEKKIINITEFSTSADQNYLRLPDELKNKTVREEVSK